jgi:hypothetical protein
MRILVVVYEQLAIALRVLFLVGRYCAERDDSEVVRRFRRVEMNTDHHVDR